MSAMTTGAPSTSTSVPHVRCTHPRLHIRSAHEAHTLFEAVRLGFMPIVRRRLSPTDKELESGEVFVWEEASYKGGLERWTDGKKWSQSRMREPFLFYEEKAMPSREEREAKIARRACRSLGSPDTPPPPQQLLPQLHQSPSSASASTPAGRRRDRPSKIRGLTKQTYSAYVTAENGGPTKKWHLTAYFCGTSYHELPTVADDPVLRSIIVPKGVYVTGKGLTRNQRRTGADPTIPVLPPSPSNSVSGLLKMEACSLASLRTTPNATPSGSGSGSGSDDGSQSPWSMSSGALPQTPPLHPSPPYHHHHQQQQPHGHASHQVQHQPTPAYPYHAPQPQYPVTVPPVTVVQPQPQLAPHPHSNSPTMIQREREDAYHYPPPLTSSYEEVEQKPFVQHYHASYHPQQQQQQQPPRAYVAPPPPTSNYYPPQTQTPHPVPPQTQLPSLSSFQNAPPPPPPQTAFAQQQARYAARHSVDQRALGAFRLRI